MKKATLAYCTQADIVKLIPQQELAEVTPGAAAQAWEADIPCCVHHIDGKQIADFGCPICRARAKEKC